jgi:hypothetical protein
MRRYVVRPRADSEADETWLNYGPGDRETIDVFERERAPRDTGLLDARGERLVAIEDANPIGFVRLGA